ncbi:N-acetylglucosamine kinase [Lentzea sp. JNUCC 0626]|uniref:N-acetylglucosamine kinase n=1 Tax=Lentzea sp. JNUCC 0626 TaxID=3367513 RepID=UPI003749052C
MDDVALLAVDGGNSKTDLALVAQDGTLLAAVRTPGCSHQRLGLAGAMSSLRAGVAKLRTAAGRSGAFGPAELGVFCLAGIDLPVDDDRVGAALRGEGFAHGLEVHNDMFAMLWAGSPAGWGVAVGAGTGLNCVGLAPDGREVRFPSLGRISGDWVAGGRWLGVRALGQAIRAGDGRGSPTELQRAVPEYFGLADPMAVAEAVYTGRIEERSLLALAPTVFKAAAGGDPVARELIDSVVEEIVNLVGVTVRRLDLADLAVPVVLGGGLLHSGDGMLLDGVRAGVLEAAPKAEFSVLDAPPVLGAALFGLAKLGAGEEAARRLTEQLTYDALGAVGPAELVEPPA